MINKLTLVLRSKVGLAVAGGLLVAAVGATAGLAVTGTTVHLLAAGQTPSAAQCASDDHSSAHPSSSPSDDRDESDAQGENQHAVQGTITSVDTATSSFVVTQCNGTTTTVEVSKKTMFDHGVPGVAELKVGLFVDVEGTLHSTGSFTASRVNVEENASGNDHEGSDGDDHDGRGGTSTPAPGSRD
jgi:Domain of unknown function (DUF5666)